MSDWSHYAKHSTYGLRIDIVRPKHLVFDPYGQKFTLKYDYHGTGKPEANDEPQIEPNNDLG